MHESSDHSSPLSPYDSPAAVAHPHTLTKRRRNARRTLAEEAGAPAGMETAGAFSQKSPQPRVKTYLNGTLTSNLVIDTRQRCAEVDWGR
jgi:hypothetical protein